MNKRSILYIMIILCLLPNSIYILFYNAVTGFYIKAYTLPEQIAWIYLPIIALVLICIELVLTLRRKDVQ